MDAQIDRHFTFYIRKLQQKRNTQIFAPYYSRNQNFKVKLACELKKSLFIHEREASDDLIRILSKYQNDLPLAVIHCFTGTAKEAQRYIDLGYYIGLTGTLHFCLFLCYSDLSNQN